MQAFLTDWVAGPCSDLPPSFPSEKLRNLLGSLPGAGSSAATSSSLPVPLREGSLPPRLLVLPADSEDAARWIWVCSDHREWCNVGLLRGSSDSEFEEVSGEGHNFQMKVGLDWTISTKPSHKL